MSEKSWLLCAAALVGCQSPATVPDPNVYGDAATVDSAAEDGAVDTGAVDAANYGDRAQIEGRLKTTLAELAAFGAKRAGSAADQKAGDYMRDRLVATGASDVHFESFSFPAHTVKSSSLSLTIDGAPHAAAHEVLGYSGSGTLSADVVHLRGGHDTDYVGKDVTGKIVLVDGDSAFHRKAQYRLVRAHGGVAMIYASYSPSNLVQIGTTSDAEDGEGPIPALSIGHDDAVALETALAAGKVVHAEVSVEGSVAPATGRNVVAKLAGTVPGAFLVGAHYDTWYTGSVDNSSGSAALLEVAAALVARSKPRHTIYFVAYDAEEVGLFGGYDFLRDHIATGEKDVMAFVNMEMPAAIGADTKALAYTAAEDVEKSLTAAGMPALYTTYATMELVPALFGGVVPTDIQGMYWFGVQGTTTFCNSPYYHTTADTPDKVDLPFLASSVLAFEDAIGRLDLLDQSAFAKRDENLWTADVTTEAVADGTKVTVVVHDAAGVAKSAANVNVSVDVDDFTRSYDGQTTTDASGTASLTVPTTATAAGSGNRWLHVTAGPDYPYVESIAKLP
jgi:Zn-dependent M28 family amino/carboxypeptidase